MKLISKIKRGYNLFLPISPFVLFTIGQILSHEFGLSDKAVTKFPEYDLLFQPVIIAIQIAIGLMGIIVVFYLGKIHDYKREFYKYEIDLVFRLKEARMLVNSFFKNEEVNTSFIKFTEHAMKLVERSREHYSRLPLNTVKLASGTILFYGYALFVLVYFKETQSLTGFGSCMVTFGIGIWFFVMEWKLFEYTMLGFDVNLRVILAYLTFFKQVKENKDALKDNMNQYLDSFSDILQTVESSYDEWAKKKVIGKTKKPKKVTE